MCPPNVVDLGAEVWNPEGIKILGTPVGSRQFVHEKVMERVEEECRIGNVFFSTCSQTPIGCDPVVTLVNLQLHVGHFW